MANTNLQIDPELPSRKSTRYRLARPVSIEARGRSTKQDFGLLSALLTSGWLLVRGRDEPRWPELAALRHAP